MRPLINRLKLLCDFYLKKTILTGLPVELVIEATNNCNLNCVMCTRKNMKRPVGFMDINLYKKIIDEVAPFMELIYLHGLGEPLYHPKIFEMIRYAKDKGLNVGISTNATLLTKEKARKLLSSGLDYLIIAIDAASAGTYQKVRGRNLYNRVIANVIAFFELKKKAATSPFTVLQFVKLTENAAEVEVFRRKWANSGAQVIRVKPVIDLLRRHQITHRYRRPCFYLWRQLNMISWDGKVVTPCCMDTDGEYSLGDLNKTSVKQIWNSPKLVRLRKAQLNGDWKKLSLCRNCSYPQPFLAGQVGALLFHDMTVKKVLPAIEKLFPSKLPIYD